jgi:hypothetical protein
MADKKQVHKIELVAQLDNQQVGQWVDNILDLASKTGVQMVSSDTTPLDVESPENKWIKDIISESTA